MIVKIEIDENLEEGEVVIHCKKTAALQKVLQNVEEGTYKYEELLSSVEALLEERDKIKLFQKEKIYYIHSADILFFETQSKVVYAHTREQMFESRYKLYELEEQLPGHFMRISKSTIVNINEINAITKNITASSKVEFLGTHKHAYVSRHYYRALVERISQKVRKER